MSMQIKGFNLYTKKPNAINFGALYIKNIKIPFSKEASRTLRVWLPEDYDGKKSFGVIYMCDGQNMVDSFTSAYGEWNMEDHIHNIQKEGYEGYILVGIDCPKDFSLRCAEYSSYPFNGKIIESIDQKYKNYGGELIEYIVNIVKPLIDKTFKTKANLTGVLGSSMGGLFAFECANKHPEIFNFSICFSPAFFLYNKKTIKRVNKNWKPNLNTKYVFYVGGGDKYEKSFVKATKLQRSLLLRHGCNSSSLLYMYDKKEIHHEAAWSKYIEKALKFVSYK